MNHSHHHGTFGLLLLAFGGCNFALDINTRQEPVFSALPDAGPQSDAGQPESRDDAGSGPRPYNPGVYPSYPDASVVEPWDASSPVPGPQHTACKVPAPATLPSLPSINSDAAGRPAFDFWRDRSCGEVEGYPLCGEPSIIADYGCGSCMHGVAGSSEGVCNYGDADSWCDGEGELLSFRDGACHICAPIEAKARACCEGLVGFDCRAWPYPGDSKPGQACARHEDCESGLVCKQGGTGYGLCLCPDIFAEDLRGDTDCFTWN